jgi:hypothetical protein
MGEENVMEILATDLENKRILQKEYERRKTEILNESKRIWKWIWN